MIEFLRRSDLDVKTKYFFIVMAYHSSRPNKGVRSTLETIIKRIGFSKSAARKAIKELHNARIIDLDYSLNEKMTSRCELERFKSFFLDLPDFLINYIDSDSIRKKTIDTEKNNNTSVVNKDNLSFQEFVCSFYIWIKTNKETCVCLTPYKEIGEVINGNVQKTRRILNNIIKYEFADGLRFLISFSNGEKNKYGKFYSFCLVNPSLVYRREGNFYEIKKYHYLLQGLSHFITCKINVKYRVNFFEADNIEEKAVLSFIGFLVTIISSLQLNQTDNIYFYRQNKEFISRFINVLIIKYDVNGIFRSRCMRSNIFVFYLLASCIYHKNIKKLIKQEKIKPGDKVFFYCENMRLYCCVI